MLAVLISLALANLHLYTALGRMEAMLKSGLHPIDIILLLACSENDTPKVRFTEQLC
jgi:hypothetical protein